MINDAIIPVIPKNVDSESLNEVIVVSLSSFSAHNFVLYFVRMIIPMFIIHLLVVSSLLTSRDGIGEIHTLVDDMAEKE